MSAGVIVEQFTRQAAARAKRVVGIDLTPAMVEQARSLQEKLGLANLEWRIGDVASLPFESGSFSAVTTRYSLHHFGDPAVVLAEMTLSREELGALAAAAGIHDLRWADYMFEIDIGRLMRASFPRPGDAARVRAMLEGDVGVDAMGLRLGRNGAEIRLRYPVAIVAGTKH